jgi:hypothetical protein
MDASCQRVVDDAARAAGLMGEASAGELLRATAERLVREMRVTSPVQPTDPCIEAGAAALSSHAHDAREAAARVFNAILAARKAALTAATVLMVTLAATAGAKEAPTVTIEGSAGPSGIFRFLGEAGKPMLAAGGGRAMVQPASSGLWNIEIRLSEGAQEPDGVVFLECGEKLAFPASHGVPALEWIRLTCGGAGR